MIDIWHSVFFVAQGRRAGWENHPPLPMELIVAFVVACATAAAGSFITRRMTRQVLEVRPELTEVLNQQFGTLRLFRRAHKELFPESRLRLWQAAVTVAMPLMMAYMMLRYLQLFPK